MICNRCGIKFTQLDKHQDTCNRLPTPAQIAERFHTDDNVTIETFRQEYEVDFQFVKVRLIAGGISTKELHARGKKVQAAHSAWATRQRYSRGKDVCAGCEVLLDHPLVPNSYGGFCEWCRDEGVPERMKQQKEMA